MVDLRSYKRDIERIEDRGDFRTHTALINDMVGRVNQFVTEIAKDDLMVSQIYSIENDLKHKKDISEEERSQMQDLLQAAQTAKRNIDKKKSAVRDLEKPLRQLISLVNKF